MDYVASCVELVILVHLAKKSGLWGSPLLWRLLKEALPFSCLWPPSGVCMCETSQSLVGIEMTLNASLVLPTSVNFFKKIVLGILFLDSVY